MRDTNGTEKAARASPAAACYSVKVSVASYIKVEQNGGNSKPREEIQSICTLLKKATIPNNALEI